MSLLKSVHFVLSDIDVNADDMARNLYNDVCRQYVFQTPEVCKRNYSSLCCGSLVNKALVHYLGTQASYHTKICLKTRSSC